MSTTLLYQSFGIRGYRQTRIEFTAGVTRFHVHPNEKPIRCPSCESNNVIRRGCQRARIPSFADRFETDRHRRHAASRAVARLLDAAANRKRRMMLMTAYSAGLRVSELVNLQVKDIRSNRMMIHVRSGKGDKDRFTLLSARLLEERRAYWLWCRPETGLFLNRNGVRMSVDSARQIFYKAKAKAGIETGPIPLQIANLKELS